MSRHYSEPRYAVARRYRTTRWKATMRRRATFGITRIETERQRCWWVRLDYDRDGRPRTQQSFTDSAYGGKLAAKREARAFVADQLRRRRTSRSGR